MLKIEKEFGKLNEDLKKLLKESNELREGFNRGWELLFNFKGRLDKCIKLNDASKHKKKDGIEEESSSQPED